MEYYIGFVFGMAIGAYLTKRTFIADLKYKARTGIRMSIGGYFFDIKNMEKIGGYKK